MIDSSEKHNCQLAFELQHSHVCEKRSKPYISNVAIATVDCMRENNFCHPLTLEWFPYKSL